MTEELEGSVVPTSGSAVLVKARHCGQHLVRGRAAQVALQILCGRVKLAVGGEKRRKARDTLPRAASAAENGHVEKGFRNVEAKTKQR